MYVVWIAQTFIVLINQFSQSDSMSKIIQIMLYTVFGFTYVNKKLK